MLIKYKRMVSTAESRHHIVLCIFLFLDNLVRRMACQHSRFRRNRAAAELSFIIQYSVFSIQYSVFNR
ncbi:hypothetical protein ISS30_02435 [bacterium]|nr:hypothetical protein [bacterium]